MDIPGITTDGGYADYVVIKAGAMVSMPDDLVDAEAAPLLCAGITTYNALRQSAARGGDRVAEAYEKMMSGEARFRMVLTTGA